MGKIETGLALGAGLSWFCLRFLKRKNLFLQSVGQSLGTFFDTLVGGILDGGGGFLFHAAVELSFHSGLELLVVLVGSVALGEDAFDASLDAGGVGLVAVAFGAAGLGGVRCCERTGFLAILEAAAWTRETLGVELIASTPVCAWSDRNRECLGAACPFNPRHGEDPAT